VASTAAAAVASSGCKRLSAPVTALTAPVISAVATAVVTSRL
jgi:hypothetical protein